jgi:putative tricarboxylic transport membrane protein
MWWDLGHALLDVVTNARLLMLIAAGAGLGIIGGAMPGLSAPGALAISLPFTYSMNALEGVSFLASIYTGAQYGGSITATLLNTPGAPESAVMTLDGFELTRRGLARKALQGTIWAGFIGGFIGIAFLMLILGTVADKAARFGPVQYTSLAVLGFTAMSSIAMGSRIKALAAAMLGLLFSVVGLDPITATPRYTFGYADLYGGLPLVPVLIGLFAVSEGLILVERGLLMSGSEGQKPLGFGWQDFVGCSRAMGIGSAVGLIIGVLPGGGASIASWLAYSLSRMTSKQASQYGKGALDGLLSPEAADKSMVGASLVPLLALGVPSTASAGVIIGGFELHNIVPGPDLLTSQPALVLAVIAALVVANFAVFCWGHALVRPLLRVRAIQPAVLGVYVLVLSLIGAYASNGITFSMLLAVATGIFGYFLRKADFPLAPIILGMLLGPIFDQNLRRALLASNGSVAPFVQDPISLTLLLLAAALVLTIFLGPFVRRRGERTIKGTVS